MIRLEHCKVRDLTYPNIVFEEDKTYLIVGPSGIGKSTLLRLINATLPLDEGMIFYQGKDIQTYPLLALRKELSLFGQDVFLFDGSIQSNFNQFYKYRGEALLDQATITYYLQMMGLALSLDQNVQSCSGGERQRIALAIFLSFQPRVLLLDEPTSALDQQSSITLMERLIPYCKAHHIQLVMVSHHVELMQRYFDEIIDLSEVKTWE